MAQHEKLKRLRAKTKMPMVTDSALGGEP